MISKNVITFGSCMSEGVYAALTRIHADRKWSYLNHVIHNRSDYFIDSFIMNKQVPADFKISSMLMSKVILISQIIR